MGKNNYYLQFKSIKNSVLLRLNILLFAVVALLTFMGSATHANAQVNYTISKSHNAPNPIPSGQPFTYTLTYGWSGGAPGTIYITDTIPSTLDVISAAPSSPVSNITGNIVNFTLSNLNMPSGSGTVQINVRFKPGITCEGETACNIAYINVNPERNEWIASQETCVTAAKPENKWQFKKELFAGCAIDNEVIFRISITNPSGSNIGGLNLTNINLEDLLPANAIITNVSNWWSGPSNSTSNGTSWIPLTGGPTNLQVSPYYQFYVTYVSVEFPSPDFSVGQTVENIAKLEFKTPCDHQTQTWLDTASVELCQGFQDATLHKSLNMGLYFPNNSFYNPHFSPGCCGTYRLRFKNTGTLPQNNLVMEDEVPGEVDVNNIYTQVNTGHTPVTLEIFTWNGNTCSTTPDTTITYANSGFFTESNLPLEICKIKWSYGGLVDIGEVIYNRFDVCVRDTNFKNGNIIVPGQTVVSNQATVSGTNLSPISVTHDKDVDTTQPKILATKLFIGECNDNCQVAPGGPYQPGDTVRYRLAVSNAGGLDATSASITDDLSSGLSYLGNEKYFYGSFNSITNVYNPQCCSLTTNVPSAIGGTISKPAIGDTSLVWNFPVLPARCDGSIEYFIIEFDILISEDPPALAGQHPNNFDFDAAEINPVTSNNAYLTVNAVAQIQARKQIREQGSQSAWAESDSIPQGETAEYKITVTNTGNTPLTNLCLLDIMPHVGDIQVLPNYDPRGSTFDLPFDPNNGSIGITPTGYTPTYSNAGLVLSQNPSRTNECAGFCGISDPAGTVNGNFSSNAAQTYSYKINANQGVNLAAGASLEAIIPAQVPQATPISEKACNSFGVSANLLAMPNACLSTESNNACIEVIEKIDDDKPCLRFGTLTLECLEQNEKGNWVYDFSIDITNVSGQDTWIQINPDNGNLYNINPNTLPNNTPTTVTGTFEVGQAPGSVCFDVIMYEDGSDTPVCDSTICIEYDICDSNDGCDCPFEITVDTEWARPIGGDNIGIYNMMNTTASGIRDLRITIVKSQITETCFWSGSNTYNSPAVFNQIWLNGVPVNISPINSDTLSNTEEWEFPECPSFNGINPMIYIDVPDSPGWWCTQNVEICLRYEFTDCKCNTCDTTICYNIKRKNIPIINWDWDIIRPRLEGGELVTTGDEYGFKNESDVRLDMASLSEGTLKIENPEEDEYTDAINIHSIEIQTNDDIEVLSVTSDDWSNGKPTENGIMIEGLLKPGMNEEFDIKYVNPDNLVKWVNNIKVGYTFNDLADTLYGGLQLISRTPDAQGGDLIAEDAGAEVKNVRTFALKFTNANKTQDSISRITLRVKEGSILAVGPGLNNQEFELAGMETPDGLVTLLAAQPDNSEAVNMDILPGSTIGPIYITIDGGNDDPVMLEYITYSNYDNIVTSSEIELTNPVLSVNGSEGGIINVVNSYVYPNPSSDEVNFRFNLNSNENVTFTVRDMSGRAVSTLINDKLMLSGEHSVSLTTTDLPTGTYYYTIRAGKESHTQKFVIVK